LLCGCQTNNFSWASQYSELQSKPARVTKCAFIDVSDSDSRSNLQIYGFRGFRYCGSGGLLRTDITPLTFMTNTLSGGFINWTANPMDASGVWWASRTNIQAVIALSRRAIRQITANGGTLLMIDRMNGMVASIIMPNESYDLDEEACLPIPTKAVELSRASFQAHRLAQSELLRIRDDKKDGYINYENAEILQSTLLPLVAIPDSPVRHHQTERSRNSN